MLRASLQKAVISFFSRRGEEVVAYERVIEINRGGSKKPKSRVIVLSDKALYIAQESATVGAPLTIKRSYDISQLEGTPCEGSSAATLQFVRVGGFSASFESHIQREIFLAAARKMAANAMAGVARVGAAQFVDNINVMAAEERAETVKRKTLRASGISPQEEGELLAEMKSFSTSLRTVPAFQSKVQRRMQQCEVTIVNALVALDADWKRVSKLVSELVLDVNDVKLRVEQYSQQLMTRRELIESIEHDNNTLMRTKENFSAVCKELTDLKEQLGLGATGESILRRLKWEEREIVAFFLNPVNRREVAECMNRIDSALQNSRAITERFALSAVKERNEFFMSMRKDISSKAKMYIIALTDIYREQMFTEFERFSFKNSLRWFPHKQMYDRMEVMESLITSFRDSDPEGFCGTVRHYCASMQKVYSKEIKAFFKECKRLVHRVGWKGEMKLGDPDIRGDMMQQLLENGELKPNPMRPNRVPVLPTLPLPTPYALGPVEGEEETIEAVLPGLGMAGFRLFRKGERQRMLTRKSTLGFGTLLTGTSGGGRIRPDAAFGLALEASIDIVLREELFLQQCFLLQWDTNSPATNEQLEFALAEMFGDDMLIVSKISPAHDSEDEEQQASSERRAIVNNRSLLLLSELLDLASVIRQECDGVYTITMMSMVESFLRESTSSKASRFCTDMLCEIKELLQASLHRYTVEQIASVQSCAEQYIEDPTALLPCFANFPVFVNRVECGHDALTFIHQPTFSDVLEEFTQQLFAVLDDISLVSGGTEKTGGVVASLKASRRSDPESYLVKKGFLTAFRHHAFFCATFSLCVTPLTKTLLQEYFNHSRQQRDRFEELYLSRLIFADAFPNFSKFAGQAEELSRMYNSDELQHHKVLSKENVRSILAAMPKEVKKGIEQSRARIFKHLTKGLRTYSTEDLFHRSLLTSTWTTFCQLVVSKVEFIVDMLDWPIFAGMQVTVTRDDVKEMLDAAVDD